MQDGTNWRWFSLCKFGSDTTSNFRRITSGPESRVHHPSWRQGRVTCGRRPCISLQNNSGNSSWVAWFKAVNMSLQKRWQVKTGKMTETHVGVIIALKIERFWVGIYHDLWLSDKLVPICWFLPARDLFLLDTVGFFFYCNATTERSARLIILFNDCFGCLVNLFHPSFMLKTSIS